MKAIKFIPIIIIAFICFYGCKSKTTYYSDYAKTIIDSYPLVDRWEYLYNEAPRQVKINLLSYEPEYSRDSAYVYSTISGFGFSGESMRVIKFIDDSGSEELYFEFTVKGRSEPNIDECSFVINNRTYNADIIPIEKGIYKSPDRRRAPGTVDKSMKSGSVYLTEKIRIFVEPEIVEKTLQYGLEIKLKGTITEREFSYHINRKKDNEDTWEIALLANIANYQENEVKQ